MSVRCSRTSSKVYLYVYLHAQPKIQREEHRNHTPRRPKDVSLTNLLPTSSATSRGGSDRDCRCRCSARALDCPVSRLLDERIDVDAGRVLALVVREEGGVGRESDVGALCGDRGRIVSHGFRIRISMMNNNKNKRKRESRRLNEHYTTPSPNPPP